jgi:hypothetical protein
MKGRESCVYACYSKNVSICNRHAIDHARTHTTLYRTSIAFLPPRRTHPLTTNTHAPHQIDHPLPAVKSVYLTTHHPPTHTYIRICLRRVLVRSRSHGSRRERSTFSSFCFQRIALFVSLREIINQSIRFERRTYIYIYTQTAQTSGRYVQKARPLRWSEWPMEPPTIPLTRARTHTHAPFHQKGGQN